VLINVNRAQALSLGVQPTDLFNTIAGLSRLGLRERFRP